jgi:hypothetical protein
LSNISNALLAFFPKISLTLQNIKKYPMMNKVFFALIICFSIFWRGTAQISHGGVPFFLENYTLRNSGDSKYIEMPAFDLDSVLRLDEINRQNMRGSYSFAYKFYTNIEKGRDGKEFVLADGTKIWQVNIRSKGAYSINLLFTRFNLPRGGRLFIYNADHSHVIGAFDYRNNSPEMILPVRPVAGNEITIEYSEPADAEFEAQLTIGEVNHDYRNILRREPEADLVNDFACMPDALCENIDETLVRSVVLLMINGSTACTGSLINNTENDETPYLLTAVHCLNRDIEYGTSKNMDYYITQAGTIIAFFNYSRPVCRTTMKATEEMSMAMTRVRAIVEKKDLALLEFQERPPLYYNVYYAGWNIKPNENDPPFFNLHHPSAAVKKYGLYMGNISLSTPYPVAFDELSHFKISGWTTGSTYGGSSGSPLYDRNNRIIATLSGGNSYCKVSSPDGGFDYFAVFYRGWETANPANQLKTYLDPRNTGVSRIDGLDPHKKNPFIRAGNADYNRNDRLITTEYASPNKGFLFGNSNLNVLEFAEEFNLKQASVLSGVYLLIPSMPFASISGVEIRIYEGDVSPQKLIATQSFNPQYLNYSTSGGFSNVNKNTSSVPTECFVAFNNYVTVSKKFYVAYKINYSDQQKFTVYNSLLNSQTSNTAWIKSGTQWTKATAYSINPISTSLAIQPLLRYTDNLLVPDIKEEKTKIQYLRNENRLILPNKSLEAGSVSIYEVNGRLIQTISVGKGQDSVILREQSSGTVGIVRILQGNEVSIGKFIY